MTPGIGNGKGMMSWHESRLGDDTSGTKIALKPFLGVAALQLGGGVPQARLGFGRVVPFESFGVVEGAEDVAVAGPKLVRVSVGEVVNDEGAVPSGMKLGGVLGSSEDEVTNAKGTVAIRVFAP